jgi:Na+-transporting NADH:ubiquinone oxidoreductase subunit C
LQDKDTEALFQQYITEAVVLNSNGDVVLNSDIKAFDIDIKKELAKPLASRNLPLYIANVDGETKYIISLLGAGLWGPIWGYISLDANKSTVYGTFFSHASETPGLGAEIALPKFQKQFIGKDILNDQKEFVSIAILKAGQKPDGQDMVDAISGGTITSKGVEAMLKNCIGQYDKYLQQTNGGTEE